jgi:hypothetical protein
MSETEIESFWECIRPPRDQQLVSVQPAESKPLRFELSITGVGGSLADLSGLHAYVEQVPLVLDPPLSMGTEVERHLREAVLGMASLRSSLMALRISYDYDCSDIGARLTALAVRLGHPASYIQDVLDESSREIHEL